MWYEGERLLLRSSLTVSALMGAPLGASYNTLPTRLRGADAIPIRELRIHKQSQRAGEDKKMPIQSIQPSCGSNVVRKNFVRHVGCVSKPSVETTLHQP
jgi:hypothetical protein